MRSLLVAASLLITGCAGAFGNYGPGTSGIYRTGARSHDLGNGYAEYWTESYKSGETGVGAALGFKTGYAVANATDEGTGSGLASDAHFDLTVTRPAYGVGITSGLTADRVSIDTGDPNKSKDHFFWGIPVGGYGQLLVLPRIFVHAGGAYIFNANFSRQNGSNGEKEASDSGTAVRAFGGINFVLYRSDSSDWVVRFEGRVTRSSALAFEGRDVTYGSTAIQAEIMWITF